MIGTLGLFDAPSGFSLTDAGALSVAGAVTANSGTVVLNTGTFGLGVPGAISAASATLTAGSIDIGGSVGVTGAASLVANQGAISETGSLNAGTLTGSAITTASFGGTNLIGTLADFTAPNGFSLSDGEALSVTGGISSASGAIALNTGTFGLSVPGGLSGLSASLTAGSITLGGSLGVSGVADLIANQGSISETGTLNAGTLTGSAITTASFAGTNLIGTLANFTAPNGFSLTDGEALSVAGFISSASGAIALNTGTFGLSVPGGLSAVSATLTAGSISINGSLGVSGVADLIANQGSISETGTLNAGTLTGSAITTASFGGTNLIGTLADFTAPNGFSLSDGEALSVAGFISSASGAIALNTGTFGLSVPGGLSAAVRDLDRRVDHARRQPGRQRRGRPDRQPRLHQRDGHSERRHADRQRDHHGQLQWHQPGRHTGELLRAERVQPVGQRGTDGRRGRCQQRRRGFDQYRQRPAERSRLGHRPIGVPDGWNPDDRRLPRRRRAGAADSERWHDH